MGEGDLGGHGSDRARCVCRGPYICWPCSPVLEASNVVAGLVARMIKVTVGDFHLPEKEVRVVQPGLIDHDWEREAGQDRQQPGTVGGDVLQGAGDLVAAGQPQDR